jgi:hypothetical protein
MASDDFNRIDSSILGPNWFAQCGRLGVRDAEVFLVFVTTESGHPGTSYYIGVVPPNDQYSQVEVRAIGANLYRGATVRGSGYLVTAPVAAVHQGNVYVIFWASSGAGQGLYKYVAGVPTLIQAITPAALAVGDVIRLNIVGTTLQCFLNNVQQGTDQTDASLAAGNPGITSSQIVAGIVLDNWQGGAIPSSWFPIQVRSGRTIPQLVASGMSG